MKYIAVGFLLHFCLNRIVQVKTWDLVWLSSFGSKKIFKLLLMICIECFSQIQIPGDLKLFTGYFPC